MKLLLDTHIFIWIVNTPERLAPPAVAAVESGANQVFVSVASAWEIAIKQSNKKLDLTESVEVWFPKRLKGAGFDIATISVEAALRVRSLPFHHRDPFDRLLIGQALEHGYTLVTRDKELGAYGVPVLLA